MLITDLPNAEYHGERLHVSSSSLGLLYPPARYKATLDGELPRVESDALRFGSAYHTFVLEPEKFESEFAVVEKVDRRTKEGKAKAEYYKEAYPHHTLLTEEDFSLITRMKAQLEKHDMAKELLRRSNDTTIEASIFWSQSLDNYRFGSQTLCNYCHTPFDLDAVDALSGSVSCHLCGNKTDPTAILCKTRPDLYTPSYVVDLKTSDSANPRVFNRKVQGGFSYRRQAAFQLAGLASEGIVVDDYYWVVQEKEAPFMVSVVKADPETLEYGHQDFIDALEILRNCRDTDYWPAYPGVNETYILENSYV